MVYYNIIVLVVVARLKEVLIYLLFKFTEKHDKDHEPNNKADTHTHTHAPQMYTPMY